MNKPNRFEGRSKKRDSRQQEHGPDAELQASISNPDAVAQQLGVSREAVLGDQTANLASEENQEQQRAALGELVDSAVPMAQAPFPGMEREWTAEEKAGMNDALRQYGWKDGIGQEQATPVPDSTGSVADALEITAADGQELRDQFAEVNGKPEPLINTILGAGSEEPSPPIVGTLKSPDGLMLESHAEVLRLLEAGHEAIAKGWVKDMRTFMHELIFKLDGVPVTGLPGEFDESWVSNQTYIPKNLILFVVRVPRIPIPGIPGDMLKRVLELHPISITGLKRSFRTRDRDMARTMQRFEAQQSVVRMEFGEKYGRAIGKMFETMARRVCEVAVNANTTVDFMLIEPDPTHTHVLDAWLCSDMWPSEVENVDGVRDITSSKDPAHVDVTWSGTVDRGEKIDAQAQELFSQFIAASANPYETSVVQ